MASERLSKLQKWILKWAYENMGISRRSMKHYFNKGPRDGPSNSFRAFNSGLGLTNSERVTLHKSLNNLLQKGLLTRGAYRRLYVLTEKGFDILKVNNCETRITNISFKDYQEWVEKNRQECEASVRGFLQALAATRIGRMGGKVRA